MKMTSGDFAGLREFVVKYKELFRDYNVDDQMSRHLSTAIDRLEYLENAVAWNNWDVLPETQRKIELLNQCTFVKNEKIMKQIFQAIVVCEENETLYVCINNHFPSTFTVKQIKDSDFVGWRYSVGDLE